MKKLNVNPTFKIERMIDVTKERCQYWKAKYNVLRRISPKNAEPFAVIQKSYELLGIRLKEQQKEYEKAQQALAIFNHYIYGKD